jgi:hypothetical protein
VQSALPADFFVFSADSGLLHVKKGLGWLHFEKNAYFCSGNHSKAFVSYEDKDGHLAQLSADGMERC